MNVSEAARLMKGLIEYELKDDRTFSGAYFDSRLVTRGSLFFAVAGEYIDGNQYVGDALQKGVAAVIMTDKEIYKEILGNKILVADTIEAVKFFGAKRLKETVAKKIAVTGSFGKTGTKETIKNILSERAATYATVGNKNNELGLALTGAGIDDAAKFIVLEMGSNALGEIEALSKTAEPDVAVVVSTGLAHVGKFGGLENIIKEKLSIVSGLKKGGTLIIPEYLKQYAPHGDYKIVTFGEAGKSDFYITELKRNGFNISFKINKDDHEYIMPHIYEHLAYNSLAGIAVSYEERITPDEISNGLKRFNLPKGHGNIENAGNLTIINDTYNAGLDSVIKGVESLHNLEVNKKYAILGMLGEIDGYEEQIYKDIALLAEKYSDITFYLCGENYANLKPLANRRIFSTKEECIRGINIKSGIVLVKASNVFKFGDIVEALKKVAHGRD